MIPPIPNPSRDPFLPAGPQPPGLGDAAEAPRGLEPHAAHDSITHVLPVERQSWAQGGAQGGAAVPPSTACHGNPSPAPPGWNSQPPQGSRTSHISRTLPQTCSRGARPTCPCGRKAQVSWGRVGSPGEALPIPLEPHKGFPALQLCQVMAPTGTERGTARPGLLIVMFPPSALIAAPDALNLCSWEHPDLCFSSTQHSCLSPCCSSPLTPVFPRIPLRLRAEARGKHGNTLPVFFRAPC